MLIKKSEEIHSSEITPKKMYLNRRKFLAGAALSGAAAAGARAAHPGTKLSLVFQLPHLPGALHTALEPFAQREINLLRIESRPMQGRPWEYRFYLDLQASLGDLEVLGALKELEQHAVNLKILGCYDSVEMPGTQIKTGAAGA